MYNSLIRYFFPSNFTLKINVHIRHRPFHMKYCTVICITRQKCKVEELPILWNMENKSRKKFCLASWITSVNVHLSHSTRVLQVYIWSQSKSVAFSQVFRWKQNLQKNFLLGFVKFPSTHLSSGFFLHKCRKIWMILKRSCKYCQPSWILSGGQVCFQVSSIINVTGIVKMDSVRLCYSKTAEENEKTP